MTSPRLTGAVTESRRRFEYWFPVDEDGTIFQLDDSIEWATEMATEFPDMLPLNGGAGFTFLVTTSTWEEKDEAINKKVLDITRRHLIRGKEVGGMFWGRKSSEELREHVAQDNAGECDER
jgi:hypothetical protein